MRVRDRLRKAWCTFLDPALMAAIKSNQTSCISSGCHQTVHDLATLKNQKFWNGGN